LEGIFARLETPTKIQDFLDKMPFNFEKCGETYRSPQEALNHNKMHCFEGALFALACLTYHGKKSFLLDLKTYDLKNDADHVLTVFQVNSRWGAISKTNHSVLRWRDTIYPSIETLVYSYFHEYFLNNGEKTLISYSAPFDVIKKFGKSWINQAEDLDSIALVLDKSRHFNFYPKGSKKFIRKASELEIKATSIEEFKSV
jgi:hypothetical protein